MKSLFEENHNMSDWDYEDDAVTDQQSDPPELIDALTGEVLGLPRQ
jgi:hypothetical protein